MRQLASSTGPFSSSRRPRHQLNKQAAGGLRCCATWRRESCGPCSAAALGLLPAPHPAWHEAEYAGPQSAKQRRLPAPHPAGTRQSMQGLKVRSRDHCQPRIPLGTRPRGAMACMHRMALEQPLPKASSVRACRLYHKQGSAQSPCHTCCGVESSSPAVS